MLDSIINNSTQLELIEVLLCSLGSLILGFIIALIHKYTKKSSKNFLITLTILPILVQSIIFMVNGSLGTSIAILGAFSLVKFRSIPGTSKEIVSIFFAMTVGLAMGMGQILFAIIITLFVGITLILLEKINILDNKNNHKLLKIVIPEDMDYEKVFDEIFIKYLDNYQIESVKSVNMGCLFEISYIVDIKNGVSEKEFIDEIRVRNGNLKIILSHSLDVGEL